jgi:hypothetical protein
MAETHGRASTIVLIYLLLAVLLSCLIWWLNDWTAYIDTGHGLVPKFTTPLRWQIVISACLGASSGLIVMVAVRAVRIALAAKRNRPPLGGPGRDEML